MLQSFLRYDKSFFEVIMPTSFNICDKFIGLKRTYLKDVGGDKSKPQGKYK